MQMVVHSISIAATSSSDLDDFAARLIAAFGLTEFASTWVVRVDFVAIECILDQRW